MVFNATFNNISVILWLSVLLVEETGGPGENHGPVASHWQTLSHNVVYLALIEIRTHNISGDRHWGRFKSNYHMVTTKMAPIFCKDCGTISIWDIPLRIANQTTYFVFQNNRAPLSWEWGSNPEVLLYTLRLSLRFLNTKSDLRYIFIQVKRVIRDRACSLITNTVCWFHIVKSKFHCAFCCFSSVIPCGSYDTGVDFILVSYYSSWGDSEFKRKSKNKRVHFTINIIKHCHKQGKLTVCLHTMNPIWLIFITEIYRS